MIPRSTLPALAKRHPKRTPADTASGLFAALACMVVLASVTLALFASDGPVSADVRLRHPTQEN